MPVIVGAGSSTFEASGSSIKIPTATANLSGINTAVGTAYYNTTSDEFRIYAGATTGWKSVSELPQLGSESNPATSAEALRINGQTTNGLYYINTADGGVQQVYCMFTSGSSQGGDYGWMLVGKIFPDAKDNTRDPWRSIRSLTDVTQTGRQGVAADRNIWSADFGSYVITEMRVIGCSDTSDWMANRSTDWIYGVPSNQTFQRFISNHNTTSNSNTSLGTFPNTGNSGAKQGLYCAGARDGRGRWTNTSYLWSRKSDSNSANYCNTFYLRNPSGTNNMFFDHSAGDSKWSVHASSDRSGQDIDSSQMFGVDDNTGPAWYDAGTGNVAQASTRVDNGWNHAVFFFIR